MVQDEIQKLLDSGSKIIQYNYPFGTRYFIECCKSEVHLDTRQFTKFKAQCNNRDESDRNALRGKTTVWYYWK